MRKAALTLTSLLVLSSCVWQNTQPAGYPMVKAELTAQPGDVITTLSTPTIVWKDGPPELLHEKINHTASLRALKRHIAEGLPVDTPDAYGLPAVAHSAAVGDVAYLTELIARGAELNYPAALERPEPGNSCLFSGDELSATGLAARYGQTTALQLLLRHGAHPYGVEETIVHDHLDCLKLLHAAGGDLHEGEHTTDDIFYPATCNARSEEVLRYLITHGVSPRIPAENITQCCPDVNAAERYLNMYLRTGAWSPQQAAQFRSTSPLYHTPPAPPAPPSE